MLSNSLPRYYLIYIFLMVLVSSCEKDATTETPDAAIEPLEIEENKIAKIQALSLYESLYEPSEITSEDPQWLGSVENCQEGTVSDVVRQKILKRIKYYRSAVGITNTVTENTTQSYKAQEAALMMSSNQTLDHYPTEAWSCYTANGRKAAENSNLALASGSESIDLYMQEPGTTNKAVGHRRWLLKPDLTAVGIGNTNTANVIWVTDNSNGNIENAPEKISWPPEGYSPISLTPERWSFSILGADFSKATITMISESGNIVPLTKEELNTEYPTPTIVWVPTGVPTATTTTTDIAYQIQVKNVSINSVTKNYTYNVILFNAKDL